jgi:hypothetical protein
VKAVFKGYKFAIEWIAFNDEPGEKDLEAIEHQISVALVADLFTRPAYKVAWDVLKLRLESKS